MPNCETSRPLRAAIVRSKVFVRCRKGIAAVEFAMIAPIMLTMFIGVTELAQAITAERRMSQVMASIADIVARQQTVSTNLLVGYMNIVTPIMTPYPTSELRMTIASVYAPSAAPTTNLVCWSYQHNTGAVAISSGAASTIPIPADLLAGGGSSVVAVEISYEYTPVIAFVKTFLINNQYRARFYLKPRGASIIQKTDPTTTCN